VLEMVLDEGKNREIRRMLARLGHKVHQLKRVSVGGLSLGNLLPGQWRQLAWSEVETLRRDALAAVGPDGERMTLPRRGPGPRQGARPGDRRRARPAGRGGPVGRPGQTGRPSPTGRPGATGRPSPTGRPGPAKKPRRPGKASSWRKPRGGAES
jgi:23S rRNA pseudouridine2605 synthase